MSFYKLSRLKNKLTKEEREELSLARHARNYDVVQVISYFVFVFNLILLFVDIYVYKSLALATNGYRNLFYIHLLTIASLLVYYAFMAVNRYIVDSSIFKNIVYFYFIISNLFLCVIIAVNSLLIHNQISAYTIVVLALSFFIIFRPLESFILIFTNLVVFIIGVIVINDNPSQIYGYIINSSIASALAIINGRISYSVFIENYISRKTILKNNIKLKETDRLKSILLGNISHELKTPLNLIYSAEQMINIYINKKIEDSEAKAKLSKYLMIIKQNSYRLMRLINNIIVSTKMDIGEYKIEKRNVDIIPIINQIVKSVKDYIEEKGINISFNTDLEKKIINFDPDSIERILLNLISNAVKYTPEGGSIDVNVFSENKSLLISVKDTGTGIPEELRKSIFNRYVQADDLLTKKSGGSGIGLSLVKYLVERHKGIIEVNSTLGQGSEFIVKLPNKLIDDKRETDYQILDNDQIIENVKLEFSDIYQQM